MATRADVDKLDSTCLLQTLTAVRKGDFSVRLPNTWAGIDGKIADTLNDIIEMMSDSTEEIERVSRVVGREGKLSQRVAPIAVACSIEHEAVEMMPPASLRSDFQTATLFLSSALMLIRSNEARSSFTQSVIRLPRVAA